MHHPLYKYMHPQNKCTTLRFNLASPLIMASWVASIWCLGLLGSVSSNLARARCVAARQERAAEKAYTMGCVIDVDAPEFNDGNVFLHVGRERENI